MDTSNRSFFLNRKQALADERNSFESQWNEIAQYLSPRTIRWLDDSPTDRGAKAYKKIIDPTGSLAVRNYVSGMMSMVTNPSRKWQKYTTRDSRFANNVKVKTYLADCEDIDRDLILKSNFYTEAAKLYKSACMFGTGAMLIEEDDAKIFRCETFSIGSFYLGKSDGNTINEFLRVYTDTPRNIVKRFGEENCSDFLIQQSKKSTTATNRYEILHYVGPNDKYDDVKIFSPENKKFRSVYMELGLSSASYNRDNNISTYLDQEKMLLTSGYDEFPIMAVRWDSDGQDIWGSDYPGALALGHLKELQQVRKLYQKGLELQMDPAMQAPYSSRGNQIKALPGFTNYVDQNNGGARPLYETRPDLQAGAMYVGDIRDQLLKIFFNDLFLMISSERRSGTKAREIEELAQERMTMLSPVLERFSDEFLDPASSRIFNLVEKRGLHPLPPPEFEGENFTVEYISVLATTLKMQGLQAIDRAVAFTGQVAAARPEALDKIHPDRLLDVYYADLNVDPHILATEEEVASERNARRQSAMQQAQQQQLQVQADAAKTLSETKLSEDNALTAIMNQAGI